MKSVLFLCTGNACRSQIAEGWARHLRAEDFTAHSAGVAPHGVDPRAVRVMAEVGVDISRYRSKHVDELLETALDLVVTVCRGVPGVSAPGPETTSVVRGPTRARAERHDR